jgi:hypothetical protein
MATAVYALCAFTSAVCAALLVRAYLAGRVRLLMWTSLCFVGFTVNNLLLVMDKTVFRDVDLSVARSATLAASAAVLLLGLVWETR